MTTRTDHRMIILETAYGKLLAYGIDFGADYFTLSLSQRDELHEWAQACRYKGKTQGFFGMLSRLFHKS
ncbi:hypothetical protein [Pseudomonas phage Waldo5]|uniref:Uncharacterized protein n=1 Tax=Pseudomonas phage Waldo5 TaxID=2762290 RepID=A0A7G8LJL5_9CAUD|nr:hypothetical protein [Pseudomonas phage Waldo5]